MGSMLPYIPYMDPMGFCIQFQFPPNCPRPRSQNKPLRSWAERVFKWLEPGYRFLVKWSPGSACGYPLVDRRWVWFFVPFCTYNVWPIAWCWYVFCSHKCAPDAGNMGSLNIRCSRNTPTFWPAQKYISLKDQIGEPISTCPHIDQLWSSCEQFGVFSIQSLSLGSISSRCSDNPSGILREVWV